MTLSLRTLAAVAAVVVLAVAGAAWFGRSTGVVAGPGASPGASAPAASPSGPTVASFRAAWNAICVPALARVKPLNDQLGTAGISVSQQTAVLDQIVTLGTKLADDLAALQVPPGLATEVTANITHRRDSTALIGQERDLLRAGKVAEGHALDDATNLMSHQEELFTQKYALSDCP